MHRHHCLLQLSIKHHEGRRDLPSEIIYSTQTVFKLQIYNTLRLLSSLNEINLFFILKYIYLDRCNAK